MKANLEMKRNSSVKPAAVHRVKQGRFVHAPCRVAECPATTAQRALQATFNRTSGARSQRQLRQTLGRRPGVVAQARMAQTLAGRRAVARPARSGGEVIQAKWLNWINKRRKGKFAELGEHYANSPDANTAALLDAESLEKARSKDLDAKPTGALGGIAGVKGGLDLFGSAYQTGTGIAGAFRGGKKWLRAKLGKDQPEEEAGSRERDKYYGKREAKKGLASTVKGGLEIVKSGETAGGVIAGAGNVASRTGGAVGSGGLGQLGSALGTAGGAVTSGLKTASGFLGPAAGTLSAARHGRKAIKAQLRIGDLTALKDSNEKGPGRFRGLRKQLGIGWKLKEREGLTENQRIVEYAKHKNRKLRNRMLAGAGIAALGVAGTALTGGVGLGIGVLGGLALGGSKLYSWGKKKYKTAKQLENYKRQEEGLDRNKRFSARALKSVFTRGKTKMGEEALEKLQNDRDRDLTDEQIMKKNPVIKRKAMAEHLLFNLSLDDSREEAMRTLEALRLPKKAMELIFENPTSPEAIKHVMAKLRSA